MNITDLELAFPKDEDKIIKLFLFPDELTFKGTGVDYYSSGTCITKYDLIYTDCDFHLNNLKIKKVPGIITHNIPGTLDLNQDSQNYTFKNSARLILFYYNKEQNILDDWTKMTESIILDNNFYRESSGTSVITTEPGTCNIKRLEFKTVNLDFEKNIQTTFENFSLANPYKWLKINSEEKKHFVVFYLEGLPVEFYKGNLRKQEIKSSYVDNIRNNYYTKYIKRDLEYINEKRKEKTKIFDHLNLKEKYFKALEDNKPVNGIKKGRYYKIILTAESDKYKFIEVDTL